MPRGLRKFRFSFAAKGLTRYGGLLLFHQFCKSLGLRRYLQTHVAWPGYAFRSFHPADLLLAHLYAIVAGVGRVEDTRALLANGILPSILGLDRFPHRDTLRSFLQRFGQEHLDRLRTIHDRLRQIFMDRLGLGYSAIIDADTTTITTHGHPEEAALGYVPKLRHRALSYAPLLSSEGRIGLSLGFELRPGNVHSSTDAAPFLKAQIDKLPSTIASSRTRVRLDAGFYDKEMVEALEGKSVGYVIVARMTQPLKACMCNAPFHEYAPGWEAGEFMYAPHFWTREHRFVAVRRPVEVEREEVQRNLFTYKKYTYHRALVTNLPLKPESVYRFYCDRASQELLIREIKTAFQIARIPSRRYFANATYMEMALWAYDLVLGFQHLCLPEERRHWNIATLRRELWWLPAEWVRRDNRNLIRLPERYPHKDLFERIQAAAERVKPLI